MTLNTAKVCDVPHAFILYMTKAGRADSLLHARCGTMIGQEDLNQH